ncbi:MAG: ABC transporter ATP-binding protein [Spirochaetales bacterium]|nr:ABC transporter ATP-binding protein [Spirochaetales bacterium]
MPYLECRNLKRVFQHFTLDISFSMEKGELLCILGPSGSGKSTLLSAIAGIDSSVSGQFLLDGKDITSMPVQKRRIGMVFQDFSLFPSMNVEKNIQYGMRDVPAEEKERQTEKLLEMVSLPGYAKRKVNELSGGEAQRIALARAVAAKPQILLLDEPMSALDAPLRKRLRSTIRQIHDQTKITMLYVTHDREEAFAIADRIMIMRAGKLEAMGTPQELYQNPPNLFVANFTGEGSAIKVPHIVNNPAKNVAFFRPEDAVIIKRMSNETGLVLKDALVESYEFTGSDYMVRLSYKGQEVLVRSNQILAESTTDIYVSKDKLLILEAE